MKPDEELLEHWRNGDKAAGNELFHRHFDSICRFFASKTAIDVDDLIQRTFLACVEGRERYRGEASFRGYLFGIARNILRRYYRDRHYEGKLFDPLVQSAQDIGPSPSVLVAAKREQQLLLLALRSLALDHQITLELYYWENMSGHDLALVLEIPEGTVRGRIRRAKELLKDSLKKLAQSPDELASTLANLGQWAYSLRNHALRESSESNPQSGPNSDSKPE